MLMGVRLYQMFLSLNTPVYSRDRCDFGNWREVILNSWNYLWSPAPNPTCEGLNVHLALNKADVFHRTRRGVAVLKNKQTFSLKQRHVTFCIQNTQENFDGNSAPQGSWNQRHRHPKWVRNRGIPRPCDSFHDSKRDHLLKTLKKRS